MNRLVAILGPTGVGKSQLALQLAQSFPCEIVNADSRQLYRYMDIGTAKPTPQDRAQVPHHLLDVVDPGQDFSLALFQGMAYRAIEDIQLRGRLPLLVGGSGLYVWAVVEGWQIPRVPPHRELRQSLEARARREGIAPLYTELQRLDPVAAGRIDPHNLRRVIRALEVCLYTGRGFSSLEGKRSPSYPVLILGLNASRKELYRRIDARVDSMIVRGWVAEVDRLLARGYGLELPALSAVGYQQIGQYVLGKLDMAQAIQGVKYATHRFARHQYAWFRPTDQRIHWLEAGEASFLQAIGLVAQFIQQGEGVNEPA